MLSFTHFNHLLLLPLPPTTQFKFQAPFPKFQLQSHFSLQLFPQPPSISHFLANRPSGCRQLCLYSSNSLGFSPSDEDFDDELDRLLVLLPEEMRRRIREHEECHQLIEVVLDLGRKPLARFPTGDFLLSDSLVTVDDLRHATSKVCSALRSRSCVCLFVYFDKIAHVLFDCLSGKLKVQYNFNLPSQYLYCLNSSNFSSKVGSKWRPCGLER